MSKKCKKHECPAGERWAVPYADFLSLLLALFIALYAISAQNTEKVKALKTEFIRIFDFTPKPEAPQPVKIIPPNPGETKDITESQQRNKATQLNTPVKLMTITQLSNLIQDGGLLEQVQNGVTLRLPSDILFKPDSAELIDPDRLTELALLSKLIEKLPPEAKVDVKGFTQGEPSAGSGFADSYELAAKRSYNVMRYLMQNGANPNRLSYSSYGKYRPAVQDSHDTASLANNRVEIFFYTTKADTSKVEGILDRYKK